jgi:hypothetical protein
MLGLQEVDQKKNQKGCSGKYASLWTTPHGREPAARTRDATDTKLANLGPVGVLSVPATQPDRQQGADFAHEQLIGTPAELSLN